MSIRCAICPSPPTVLDQTDARSPHRHAAVYCGPTTAKVHRRETGAIKLEPCRFTGRVLVFILLLFLFPPLETCNTKAICLNCAHAGFKCAINARRTPQQSVGGTKLTCHHLVTFGEKRAADPPPPSPLPVQASHFLYLPPCISFISPSQPPSA